MVKRGYSIKTYYINSLDKKITVKLGDTDCFCDNYGEFIVVGKKFVEDAISSNDIQRLSSLIYHELGHLTNVIKSNDGKMFFNSSQTRRDFRNPLFLFLDNNDERDILYVLYRFHYRELRARCFETTMFLKKNKNKNITIQDIYNDRCSDITLMRGFIKLLEQGEIDGPESKYGKILDSIGKATWRHSGRFSWLKPGKYKVSWKYNARKTINYFNERYLWLKKRVDKIFYDYKQGML